MIENVTLDALAQAPAILAVVLIVVMFLRFLNELSKRNELERQHFANTIAKVANDCHDYNQQRSNDMRELFNRNQEIILKNTEVIGETKSVLSRIKL